MDKIREGAHDKLAELEAGVVDALGKREGIERCRVAVVTEAHLYVMGEDGEYTTANLRNGFGYTPDGFDPVTVPTSTDGHLEADQDDLHVDARDGAG